ncbi:MAG: hypothetical protein GTN65_12105, partial [Armatimonadetes bacterium]|nr:hypothetical protein [Armatimonadota bacterium]NIO97810.1 hypothetical protein [Armatimonadota bacterium]
MDIERGFQIDEPEVFVPWEIDEGGLVGLLEKHGLRKVTKGYYCVSCKSLGGLSHELGFHFDTSEARKNKELEDFIKSKGKIVRRIGPIRGPGPLEAGRLRELEFFRRQYPDLRKSFDEFQSYAERAFGKPSDAAEGGGGFGKYEWKFKGVRIYHYVLDRF